MSIATNTDSTPSQALNQATGAIRSGLFVRHRSAGGAPGFAQVLRAFDAPENELDRSPDTSVQDHAQDDVLSQGSEDQQASTPGGDEESTIHADDTQQGVQSTIVNNQEHENETQASQNQPADGRVQGPQTTADMPMDVVATTSKQAASFELLVNRSDQAKLSMRGLVQSLRAASSPDLTTIAVQTRTGQIEQTSQSTPTQSTQTQASSPSASNDVPEPDVAPPVPQAIGHTARNPGDALSDQPPQSGRGHDDPAMRQATPPQVDTTRVDAQQARGVRVDAAPPIAHARTHADFTRAGFGTSPADAAIQNRAQGALTERAVSGVDGGIAKEALKPLDPQAQRSGQLTSSPPESVRASVMAQVQRGLASLLRGANGDMTLRLTPSHLGTVQISVKRDGDRLSLRMTASTTQARDLLSVGRKDLMQSLEAKGVKVEQFLLDIQSIDQDIDSGGGATSGFGSEHGTSAREHAARAMRQSEAGEDVIPLSDHGTGHDPLPTGSIWSELGLDAIA